MLKNITSRVVLFATVFFLSFTSLVVPAHAQVGQVIIITNGTTEPLPYKLHELSYCWVFSNDTYQPEGNIPAGQQAVIKAGPKQANGACSLDIAPSTENGLYYGVMHMTWPNGSISNANFTPIAGNWDLSYYENGSASQTGTPQLRYKGSSSQPKLTTY
ncbi:hypothetical protein [Calothrix rhizosoleniae]|uniref:hypothetical protein n=1 Tax=Calothrix rhizosoleniae TaxID=888997 RepID=UPI000B4A4054|nr:hypothetical protein [Calothrix rhizosoleniae]